MMTKTSKTKTENLITKKELNQVFWRSFQMEFSWNYERQMNMAYVYAMIPILKKLYPQKEEMAAALKRHLAFFNTTPHIVTFILGINAAMEEENVLDENFEVGTIDSIKTSLMGPLAGLGDSFFWGTLRLITTGVGTSLALQGNVLGPILFLLIFNVPHVIVRYLLNRWGYKLGTGFLKKIQANGMMESLTLGASIIGLMVVGAMTASMIDLTIPITISGSGKNAVTVQNIFDDIMPKLLPLASFGFVFYLLKKEVKPLAILGGMAIVGILGSLIGLF
ncbi:TPA: PTS system mannose/fructose/sorbose family transporter subunit IID [Enterococcus faecalis]|nr:PTS system mannose/fructose/sorbose family transporter subunit IID [Enterococcus faecalis]